MNQPSLDLASFITAIFAVFIAPPLAHVMGVYTAIIVGAVFGAGLALIRSYGYKLEIVRHSRDGTGLAAAVAIGRSLKRWEA